MESHLYRDSSNALIKTRERGLVGTSTKQFQQQSVLLYQLNTKLLSWYCPSPTTPRRKQCKCMYFSTCSPKNWCGKTLAELTLDVKQHQMTPLSIPKTSRLYKEQAKLGKNDPVFYWTMNGTG